MNHSDGGTDGTRLAVGAALSGSFALLSLITGPPRELSWPVIEEVTKTKKRSGSVGGITVSEPVAVVPAVDRVRFPISAVLRFHITFSRLRRAGFVSSGRFVSWRLCWEAVWKKTSREGSRWRGDGWAEWGRSR